MANGHKYVLFLSMNVFFPHTFFNRSRPSTNVALSNEVERLLPSDTPCFRKDISFGARAKNYILKGSRIIYSFLWFISTEATIVSECLRLKRVTLSCHLVRCQTISFHMY